MDTLERALFEAGLTDDFKKAFRGSTANYISCLNCQHDSQSTGEFFDLILPIRNFGGQKFGSIEESIQFILTPELLDGSNQYSCGNCNTKADALKGLKFNQLPDVLTISLMRFDFNYDTFERIKINDYYKFDLRLDLSSQSGNSDDVYDLFAVIVHRGDAYGGHYHTIIRDTLKEADRAEEDQDKLMAGHNAKGIDAKKVQRTWLPEAKPLPKDL